MLETGETRERATLTHVSYMKSHLEAGSLNNVVPRPRDK